MGFRLVDDLGPYRRDRKAILRKFPRSVSEIDDAIAEIVRNPASGDLVPGFPGFQVYKARIGLKRYRLSKSRGLRFWYLVLPNEHLLVPITLYSKSDYPGEPEVREAVKSALKEILASL